MRPPSDDSGATLRLVESDMQAGASVVAVLWGAGVLAGFWHLADYEITPGPGATAPVSWPTASPLARVAGRPTLLLFAHPRCPCTRASLGELARLVAQTQGRAAVEVLFFEPVDGRHPWTETDLWRSARAIPGVRVTRDPGGQAARLFGATTSGQVVLYDPDGSLLFHGGITGSRGHAGDNAGRSALTALLRGGDPITSETAVYGCAMHDECGGTVATWETP